MLTPGPQGAGREPAGLPDPSLTWPELLHQHQAPPGRVEHEDGHAGGVGEPSSAQKRALSSLPSTALEGWVPCSDGQTEAQAGTELARVTLPGEDPGLLYVLRGRSGKDTLGSWTGWGWQHLRARE